MLQITDYAFPSPDQWRMAIQGMRNPLNSWEKSDSELTISENYCEGSLHHNIKNEEITGTSFSNKDSVGYDEEKCFKLGPADKKLLLNLCKAGSEHRKVLRFLDVDLRITAPLYFWKQLDAYKVGIVMNSCSTMHTIHKEEFSEDDFSIEPYRHEDEEIEWSGGLECMQTGRINLLNSLRAKYLETKDKYYWQKMIEFLPESYNQTRNIHVSYEWIINYIFQRRGHKLPEHDIMIKWLLSNVPLVEEIVEAIEC